MSTPDVAVIGGGLIGLGIAWRAATAGMKVTVLDETPGRGASWAAAGMLAPVTEVHYVEEPLLALNLVAARLYPQFVADLEAAAGQAVGYRRCGTLSVALDADDDAAIEDLFQFQLRLELPVRRLTGRQCRDLEPMLAPGVRSGLLAEADHQIDNRLLVDALLVAARRAGVTLMGGRVDEVVVEADRVRGVRLGDGRTVSAPAVVLAAGCRSAEISGLPAQFVPPVRPVKGQLLALRGPASPALLSHNLRGLVRGRPVYLVPRADGRVIVGATVEELGFDTRVTVEGTRTLLRDAHRLVPGVDELEVIETRAGLRPGSPDNAPMLGTTGIEGLVVATGHFRHGVLLTPVTADAIAALLTTGRTPDLIAPFTPSRFNAPARLATGGRPA